MINFQYSRANDIVDAVRQMAASPSAKFIAGGTNLVDLMKMDVERPAKLIDVSKLELDKVEETASGGLRNGATRCCRVRCRPARHSNCATWHLSAATSCNAHVALTFTTSPRLATNVSRAAAARQLPVTTG